MNRDDAPGWVVWGWIICTAVIGAGYIWGIVVIIEAMGK
jgi:hypothetical protein